MFLDQFQNFINPEIKNGIELNAKFKAVAHDKKIFPKIIDANPEHAKEITEIYKDAYDGTYPYKEMEDEIAVRRMLENECFRWFIFKDHEDTTAGCFTYQLDFEAKKGYMRGFILKKKYFGRIDVVKTTIGCMVKIWRAYKDKIYVWYAENRTAHAKAQHMAVACGIMPIAFFPNKDVFEGKIESDVMHIIYDQKALKELRRNDKPRIIPSVARCFFYAISRYHLGDVKFEDTLETLDYVKLVELTKRLIIKTQKDKFGYEVITFSFKDSDSYFAFLYTPQVQNFEKTKYHVHNAEELFVFVQEFIRTMRAYNARYCECFVSAYLPEHQKIFKDAGLMPRGYIPSWKYNYNIEKFEDHIVFNYYEGQIDESLQLVDEAEKLVLILGEL